MAVQDHMSTPLVLLSQPGGTTVTLEPGRVVVRLGCVCGHYTVLVADVQRDQQMAAAELLAADYLLKLDDWEVGGMGGD